MFFFHPYWSTPLVSYCLAYSLHIAGFEDVVPFDEGDDFKQFLFRPLNSSLGGAPYTLFSSGLAPPLFQLEDVITHREPFLSAPPFFDSMTGPWPIQRARSS